MDKDQSHVDQKSKPDDRQYLFDKPQNVQWLMRIFYGSCILLLILDFVVHRHIYLDWERIPAFYALYGFISCVVLVFVARVIRKLVMRSEDYYDVD